MSSSPAVAATSNREGLFDVACSTYREFINEKWRAAALALDHPAGATAETELNSLLGAWADRPIGFTCEYPSFVARDGFPVEFSVSWRNGVPELRVLFESLGAVPTARSAQDAGRALTRSLAGRPGVSIERYLAVEDLFVVDDPEAFRPTVWHSLTHRPGRPPGYKVYLNPQARGVPAVPEVMLEAMSRLGLARAWEPVARSHDALAEAGHQVEFFALDLADSPEARVKVYFRHVGPVDLDEVAALARRHDPALLEPAYRDVYGSPVLPDNEPMTCLAFRAGVDGPDEANVYLRLPGVVRDDEEAAERIGTVLRRYGVDPARYRAVAAALAPREPATTLGLHELLSVRAAGARPDLGVYFRFGVYDRPVPGLHV
ncbi:DMATS type aromatic prenyltransferase [Saccharothrix variisporea]|uniref:DMATS type aromatic prenyltransferase n=1 Tax=Saccharothrix variisporea TaxID=543527 RepID=A0A495XAA2_9PSEU|nr:DMATS type aromatic prenyltransferase [Saccharothrix variisporea]